MPLRWSPMSFGTQFVRQAAGKPQIPQGDEKNKTSFMMRVLFGMMMVDIPTRRAPFVNSRRRDTTLLLLCLSSLFLVGYLAAALLSNCTFRAFPFLMAVLV